MKKLLIILLLLTMSVQAQTVHRWNKELSDACSQYLTTEHTRRDLYRCLIYTTKSYYIWRHGWEEPVEADVMGIVALYRPAIFNLSYSEKEQLADYYNKTTYKIIEEKMLKNKNLDVKFTQEDIERIWRAELE